MEVNGAPKQPGYKLSSKYLPLCSAEQRNSYRCGTTWEWVNDDRTIPLRYTATYAILKYYCSANKRLAMASFDWQLLCSLPIAFHVSTVPRWTSPNTPHAKSGTDLPTTLHFCRFRCPYSLLWLLFDSIFFLGLSLPLESQGHSHLCQTVWTPPDRKVPHCAIEFYNQLYLGKYAMEELQSLRRL